MLFKQKQTVYWDVDDVILNSLETSIDIINKKYNEPHNLPNKTIKDAKDWNMKSIYSELKPEQLIDIFECDDFWNNIRLRDDFIQIITKKLLSKYQHCFVTKGTQLNLELKRDFLKEELSKFNVDFEHFDFIGVELENSKGNIDMSNNILIDDNIINLLESNAKIKILITNGNNTCYNNAFGSYNDQIPDNFYVVNNLKQVGEILKFNLEFKL